MSMAAPSPTEIRRLSLSTGSPFFSYNNMRFAGDTMRNFGSYRDAQGRVILYRKKAVKCNNRSTFVFDEVQYTLRART
jgi:hypothetical protein